MKERELQFTDERSVLGEITTNKIIIDYVCEYQQQEKITAKQLQ